VTRKIARAAARISRGLEQELVLGNISARRDWGHAQDYVVAMWLMLQAPAPDDYIVATGETHSVEDFVNAAFEVVHLPAQKYLKRDAAFERPTEPGKLVGSSEKIRRILDWAPRKAFRDLVREMVEAELSALSLGTR